MPIEFPCPACNSLLRTPDSSVGKKAKCPKCGAIAEVPGSPSFSAAPVPSPDGLSDNPFDVVRGMDEGSPAARSIPPIGSETANPFADASDSPFAPQKPVDTYNPYATPQSGMDDQAIWSGGESLALNHRLIDFGQVFNTSWKICSDNLGPCLLLGLVVIGVLIGIQIVSRVAEFAGTASGSLAAVLVIQLGVFCFNFLIQVGIQLGLWNFGIRLARDRRAEVGDLFQFGPFLVRGILVTLLIWLISMGIVMVCGVPIVILVVALGGEQAFNDVPYVVIPAIIAGVAAASVAMIWISFRLLLVMPLIVDRDLGVMDAVRASDSFMKGNKLTAFLVMIVAGLIASAITIATCCIGGIFAYPYLAVVTATIYLSATGQPLQSGKSMFQR